ncbi:T9SS type A sorting domain-containing protein [Algibacter sp. L3A6]|uniref:T9SS type A sorting domain-containing protein n=1 Tax=Algibacter sp. L3A6 TaxID=2686366 RepID=UPI00131C9516|nr:T9SS type A sorting domain-containing protein [Algibacter sp. L3A6]
MNVKNTLIKNNAFSQSTILLVFLLFAVTFSVQAQFVHPGISHKLSDLDRMKYMVEAGIEPWATTFVNFSSHPRSQYNMAVDVDPAITTGYTDASQNWFINDGVTAYNNAIMWYITGDSRHADKAIEVFNTWKGIVRNEKSIPLDSGRVWRIIEAAEIIEHTYNGWTESDIQAFKDMLVYPGYSNTTVPTAAINSKDISFYWKIYNGDPARHGNQGLFAYRTMLAMAIFLDNEIMYDRALNYLKGEAHRPDDLPYPSGPSINSNQLVSCEYFDEFSQNGFESTVVDYGFNEVIDNYIYSNGQCQESSRDQAHGLAGVATITVMSEMAWNQGDDLYGHLSNRPLLGLEFYYRYNLSLNNSYPDQTSPWEPTVASGEYIERTDRSGRWRSLKINPYVNCDDSPEALERGKHYLMPVYEMNLGHYKDRMGLPSNDYKWLNRGMEILTAEIGVEGEGVVSDHPGYGGLKFRRVSPGDPISGFNSNGFPDYNMNVLPMTIEAENYDYFVLNGQDRAYNDISVTNDGGEYRIDEGVDLKECSEGGYNVTGIQDEEWLTYTVSVPSDGTYDIDINYASVNANGKIKFNFGGEDITSEVIVPFGAPNSIGLTDWKTFKVGSSVRLSKGVQAMKVLFSGSDNAFELNNITVSLVAEDLGPINLAHTYGTASHSIDSDPCPYGGCAELAIDGNTNGNFGSGSVSHSAHGTNGSVKWWEVDLSNNYKIETIDIYNRSGYESRLLDITVEVKNTNGDVVFSKFYSGYPNPTLSIDTGGVVGSVVRISKTSDTGITLAEVEIYGVDNVIVLSNIEHELEQVVIYPNPVSNELNISLGLANLNLNETSIKVFALSGQKVLETKPNSNNIKLDVSQLNSGIYMLMISDTSKNITRKIVKL